jgi:hypothetical protein
MEDVSGIDLWTSLRNSVRGRGSRAGMEAMGENRLYSPRTESTLRVCETNGASAGAPLFISYACSGGRSDVLSCGTADAAET